MTWADAHLTENGIGQAKLVNAFWRRQISDQRTPIPQTYYTSPLRRCLATANVSFLGLKLPADRPFIPVVKEVCA